MMDIIAESEKDASKPENPKVWSDLLHSIYEQLTLPLKDGHSSTEAISIPNIPEGSSTSGDASSEISVSIIF